MITRERAIHLIAMAVWPSLSEEYRDGCKTVEEFMQVGLQNINDDPEAAIMFDSMVSAIYSEGYQDGRFNASLRTVDTETRL